MIKVGNSQLRNMFGLTHFWDMTILKESYKISPNLVHF